ncbi:MAG: SDR family oxidoreductase [Burkholderiales bacterium]|nr:SDR family oxidoreductase [Burkholderiales bacterium]
MQLDGAVCIVTGGGTGTGAACATLLASKGCRVVVNYSRSEDEAHATVRACQAAGADALAVQGNVALDADCQALAQAALTRWGRIDALVNNAGITRFAHAARLDALSAQDFHDIYDVNVVGAYQMIRACTPAMKQQGAGAVVNISSIAGTRGVGSSTAYVASKGALNAMTLALARALAPTIRVNAVCPGFIETRWHTQRFDADGYARFKSAYEANVPLATAASAVDVAETVVWLIEAARVITGELIEVDSGLHLGKV